MIYSVGLLGSRPVSILSVKNPIRVLIVEVVIGNHAWVIWMLTKNPSLEIVPVVFKCYE